MATLADLIDKLKRLASVEESEGFTDGEDLTECLTRALRQHNASYSFTSLPDLEEEPLLILGWIRICMMRASKASKDANVNGGQGFGQDRESVYNKNVRLASELKERYDTLCADLEIDTAGDGIVQGTLTRAEDFHGVLLPLNAAPLPPAVTLVLNPTSQSKTTGTEYIVTWDFKSFSNFYEAMLYTLEGANAIYEEWNFNSASGVPRVNSSATLLYTSQDIKLRTVKVTDVTKGVGLTNRFLLVLRSRSDTYAYSTELVLTGA